MGRALINEDSMHGYAETDYYHCASTRCYLPLVCGTAYTTAGAYEISTNFDCFGQQRVYSLLEGMGVPLN